MTNLKALALAATLIGTALAAQPAQAGGGHRGYSFGYGYSHIYKFVPTHYNCFTKYVWVWDHHYARNVPRPVRICR